MTLTATLPSREWIYGHRLRAGQTAIEYLLEFLNVVKGFDFSIAQDVIADPGAEQPRYRVDYRLNLRRFLFLEAESGAKNRHPADLELLRRIHAAFDENPRLDAEVVENARDLLNSFTIVSGEKGRSWFAKFLFPAHADLLFFEARRDAKRVKKSISEAYESVPSADLGTGVAIERNFFSRGGELYFLMLAHAACQDPERARRVGAQLESLLTGHNIRLGELARNINAVLPGSDKMEDHVGLGWIPIDLDGLFAQVLEELDNLLAAEVDPIEHIYLLARLIPLHLLQHIYRRSHPKYPYAALTPEERVGGDDVRPLIFVDCGRGGEGREIRRLSALTYKRNDHFQEEKLKAFLLRLTRHVVLPGDDPEQAYIALAEHLSFAQIKDKERKERLRRAVKEAWKVNGEARVSGIHKALIASELHEFRRQHLPVHRKLCYGIGFVQPLKGPNQRYVFNDTILKALVIALIKPGTELEFEDFVNRLYTRYGIIIGAEQARTAGLFEEARINSEHYGQNLMAFRRRMKEAGLLTELSDATAFVSNPYRARSA